MNLLVFNPETGVILSMGAVDPACALPADKLPAGSVYVDAFPDGPASGWRYVGGQFVKAEVSA